jgi:lysophospholipase L1-like esterase
MRSRLLRALSGLVVLIAFTQLPSGQRGASASTLIGPRSYYLALGDSLGYGYQPNFDWSHGYADDFYANLRTHGTSHYTNLACPGETSTTFIAAGCPYWYIRKTLYFGSQLNAAVAFIAAHRAQVSPVTVDIGANDVLGALNLTNCTSGASKSCTCTVAPNWSSVVATFDNNFKYILSLLRRALNGTGDLFAMNYYDPYQNECAGNPSVLAFLQTFNQHIGHDAASYGVPVSNVFGKFEVSNSSGNPVTPDPYLCGDGGYPDYTWMCSSHNDIHATGAGYYAISQAFESAAGY